jgi:hypothetical protein
MFELPAEEIAPEVVRRFPIPLGTSRTTTSRFPSLDIVVSYNDAHGLDNRVNGRDNPTNRAIKLLVDAVQHPNGG